MHIAKQTTLTQSLRPFLFSCLNIIAVNTRLALARRPSQHWDNKLSYAALQSVSLPCTCVVRAPVSRILLPGNSHRYNLIDAYCRPACRMSASPRLTACPATSPRGTRSDRVAMHTSCPVQSRSSTSQRPFRCSISHGSGSRQHRGLENHIWHDTRCHSASSPTATASGSRTVSSEAAQQDHALQETQRQLNLSLPVSEYERPPEETYTKPSIRETGERHTCLCIIREPRHSVLAIQSSLQVTVVQFTAVSFNGADFG